jgi:dihydroorotate dehydrogenase (NAD+) catalytic subunit
MTVDLSVEIAGVRFANPVLCAAGPLGHGREFAQVVDLRAFGGFVTKSITLDPREGNPRPELVEVDGGFLNSVGLRNPGLAAFLTKDLPFLRTLGIPIIASLAGHSIAEFRELATWIGEAEGVAALELNVSCPNVERGLVFGTDPELLRALVRTVRAVVHRPLFVKLTPNVTDIVPVARAAVGAGADALSLVNTLLGMAIDVRTRRPKLGGITGGLSGPAIRPVAVRMVFEVYRAVSVPLIGIGGIETAEHAAEFFLAGASAVAVASATLKNPGVAREIVEGLRAYLLSQGMRSIRELVGALELSHAASP